MCVCVCVCSPGVDLLSIHTLRSQRAASMLSDVRQLVGSGGGPEGGLDHANQDGVTLVREPCACVFVCVCVCMPGVFLP